MAIEPIKLKRGMGGSNGGKGRTAKTDVYKKQSKRKRRIQGKQECQHNAPQK